jgi:shikimate dehydrogenase
MRCAVLGDPIGHSLSPTLHRAGYAALGLDWSYEAVRVPSGGLAEFLAREEQWRGLSLTMPLKREVLALGHDTTDRARLAGGANTVVVEGDRLLLDNTDLPGAVAAVRERFDGEVRSVTVLGAGATAASVGLALCDLGATTLRVLSRDRSRAAETLAAIGAHASGPAVSWGGLGLLAEGPVGGDVVVSTIPATAQDGTVVAACADVPLVFEVLYDPWPTPLAAAAAAGSQALVGGLDLLVHQAALQFEMFTGHAAPLAAMREAGEAALAARGRP